MLSRGICIIAFGEEYDRLAAQTVALSLSNIKIPITVLTNLKQRDPAWPGSWKLNFIYLDIPTNDNRGIKNQLYKYTPYDETLYVDCDAVICRPGIEEIFNRFGNNNFVFQQHTIWNEGKRYYRIYRDAAHALGVTLPLRVCIGGFWAFRKSVEAAGFFDLWNKNWRTLGAGRDMPALACSLAKSNINYSIITKADEFFSFGIKGNAIVAHRMRADDLTTRFDIAMHIQNKEFDKGNGSNWDMVFFDDESNAIINDSWIQQKFVRKARLNEMRKYIEAYLPEIKRGGMSVFDIATGPGEFLELANAAGCISLGIEAAEKMEGGSGRTIYQKYGLIKHKEKGLNVIYVDMNDVLKNGYPRIDEKTFDIINCQHAINAIARGCFNYKREEGPYKNNGEWIFGEPFNLFFARFFVWCNKHLNKNGVIMIAALTALNKGEYSLNIIKIGVAHGFRMEICDHDLNHKFRKVA